MFTIIVIDIIIIIIIIFTDSHTDIIYDHVHDLSRSYSTQYDRLLGNAFVLKSDSLLLFYRQGWKNLGFWKKKFLGFI